MAEACQQDLVAGDEVLVIGDVFIARNHQLTASLEDLARSAGSLATDQRYRDNSSSVNNTLALVGTLIADQYARAYAESPVKVVIMNGGGADILLGSCSAPPQPDCPLIVNSVAALDQLFSQMARDGVQHIVYAFYPDPLNATFKAEMDVLRPLAQRACESSAVPCHWLDLRAIFAGHYDEYITSDGLTPTLAGSNATADAIWSTMQRNCVAQWSAL